MDCSLPGFSVHGILQARILEWVVISTLGDLPNPRIKPKTPESPELEGRFFTIWAIREVHYILPSVQFSHSVASDSLRPRDCSIPGLPVHHHLPELTQTHVLHVGDTIQPSHPLLSLLLPPSVFPSTRVFSNESVLRIRWPKY